MQGGVKWRGVECREVPLRLWALLCLLGVVIAFLTLVLPGLSMRDSFRQHARDVRLESRGARLQGSVVASGHRVSDSVVDGWSRVRFEAVPGERTEIEIGEYQMEGATIEMLYDPASGDSDGATIVRRRLKGWPWSLSWDIALALLFLCVWPAGWWVLRGLTRELHTQVGPNKLQSGGAG